MKYKIDDPKVWLQACELMVSMAVDRANGYSKPAPMTELRAQIGYLISDSQDPAIFKWTVGHIRKLRTIYLAAFNGMKFCNKIEAEHRTEICNLP